MIGKGATVKLSSLTLNANQGPFQLTWVLIFEPAYSILAYGSYS